MIFCGFRIGLFLKNIKANSKWMDTGTKEVPVDKKDNHLDELQAFVERKLLRFCDPSVPLHLFTKLTGEATIMALRLVGRPSVKVPARRDWDATQRTRRGLLDQHACPQILQPLDTYRKHPAICLECQRTNFGGTLSLYLQMSRNLRPEDDHTRVAWSKIEGLFEYKPSVIVNYNTLLYNAVSRLILKAWLNCQIDFGEATYSYQLQNSLQHCRPRPRIKMLPVIQGIVCAV